MKEKIRILLVKAVTKRKTLIGVNTAKPRPEIGESVAVPHPEIPIIDPRGPGVENLFSRELVDSLGTKPFKCILPFLRILAWYSCFNIIIKLSYPILSLALGPHRTTRM